jgi:hypothetical protein
METNNWRGQLPNKRLPSCKNQSVLILKQNPFPCPTHKSDALLGLPRTSLNLRWTQDNCLLDRPSSVPDLILMRQPRKSSNPVWPNGKAYFFRAQQKVNMNVHSIRINQSTSFTQLRSTRPTLDTLLYPKVASMLTYRRKLMQFAQRFPVMLRPCHFQRGTVTWHCHCFVIEHKKQEE